MKASRTPSLLLLGLILASPAVAQISPRPEPRMLCPNPTTETVTMGSPSVFNGDFSAATLAFPRASVNDSGQDKFFLHSFQWRPPECCQITGAVLTLTLRANNRGTSTTASNAGNDAFAVTANGATIPGLSGYLYSSFPFPINHPSTKTIVLNAAAIAHMNQNNRLSFAVQDDTAVISASLRIQRCCVNHNKS